MAVQETLSPSPVVLPGTEKVSQSNDLPAGASAILESVLSANTRLYALVGLLVGLIAWGMIAYTLQLRYGLAVTGLRDYVSWGMYITNFVFFIGISHAGTLVSAILRVTGAEWRRPITRMAEAITVFALMVGAPMVLVDMGRPDRILNIFAYGRLQSPILWDVISITTYLTGSLLYLYLPLIPDLAILKDRVAARSSWRAKLYTALSLGWKGTPEQVRLLEKAISTMAIVIMPVAVSVHTVVSWIFGMTVREGWHSTIFGPYFVVGAIYSGIAALLTAMVIFRRVYHLEMYLTPGVFRRLGYLLLAAGAVYSYMTFSEYLTMFFTGQKEEAELLSMLFSGRFSMVFWGAMVVGLLIPLLIVVIPGLNGIKGLFVASILVNIGMWLKRWIIVVPTLSVPFLGIQSVPAKWAIYKPTWVEWSITVAAFAGFVLLYILFSKLFPIISIWETQEIAQKHGEIDQEMLKGRAIEA